MKIAVKLFAAYRESAGLRDAVLDLPEGATVGDLARLASDRFAGLPDAGRIVIAVNGEYQDHAFALADGDEAALIPPVSGG